MGIQTNVSFFGVISFNAFWKFLWLGYSAWDFFGVKVWSRDFFGVLIFAPFYHPCHVKSRIPPPLGVECWPGACSWEFLVGVCCLVLQILKNPIFPSDFQTWPLKSIPFFRPGPREIISSSLRLGCQQEKDFLKSDLNLHISLSFLFIWPWN